jgi:Cdc6-like AAA superfamily ATPase
MIEELKLAIDEADRIGSKKAKEILLKIAMFKEENQKSALELVKLMLENGK